MLPTTPSTPATPEAEYTDFYRDMGPRVLAYLAAKVHLPQTDPDLQDLAGDIWCRVWAKWDYYHGPAEERSHWLFSIAHNQMVTWIKHRSRYTLLPLERDNTWLTFEANTISETTIVERLDLQRVWPTLSVRQRAALQLRADGYDNEEIGERVGSTENTARGLVFKGRKRLAAAGLTGGQ